MSIGSVTSSSAVSQSAWVSQVQQQSGTGGAGSVHRPPPPTDGGALLGAVADALQSIGVTTTGTADDGSETAASSGTQNNAAQALGSFLHELMGALHEQGASGQAGGQGGQLPDGQAYGPPGGGGGGPGGPGGAGGPGGGPGRLAADLQSLISKLGSSTTDSTAADGTDSTDSTDDADSTSTSSATTTSTASTSSTLESAFDNLLQALGADSSDAGGKLSSFLQTLADKLPAAGSSGNLINTSV
ncbi:MAG: hypothetical protein K2X55_20780 [Burkholderiaceae bacterium]|nr:hypothetical protein [Burkholderiaceae bacterium]